MVSRVRNPPMGSQRMVFRIDSQNQDEGGAAGRNCQEAMSPLKGRLMKRLTE